VEQKKRMKKLTPAQLRYLILQETKDLKTTNSPNLATLLFEQGDTTDDAAFIDVTTKTNIADLGGADAYEQLVSGDENAPLIQAMMNATGWANGAIAKAGGADAIKKWAESVGKESLTNRIEKVGAALPNTAPAKKDMPALEGEDAAAVKDALTPGGKFNVDIEASYAADKEGLDAWLDTLSDEKKKEFEAGKQPEPKEEGLVREDKYPRHGMNAMPGGGADPVGKALAFLTKGKYDGDQGDDNIDVKVGGSLANSAMIPTQSNILAGKSLLFAFLQGTGNTDLSDMGGAFVTSAGEILDGHHRWSGAYIGTGGGLTHDNVHIVDGNADELIPMLTSIGNALGNPQKESRENRDDLVLERWHRLAGLND
tara:strand:+ start:24881 stop:25987 length:1107 start_codon:yes stop_codon:yes gene_type:complete